MKARQEKKMRLLGKKAVEVNDVEVPTDRSKPFSVRLGRGAER